MVVDPGAGIPKFPGLEGRQIFVARSADATTGPVRSLCAWWEAVAARHPPRIADFDIADHGPIAPHLFVAERFAHGFVLRLAGEAHQRSFGVKKGREWRTDSTDPTERDFAAYLDFIACSGRAYRSIGRMKLSPLDWLNFEAALCPLIGADGATNRILGATCEIPST